MTLENMRYIGRKTGQLARQQRGNSLIAFDCLGWMEGIIAIKSLKISKVSQISDCCKSVKDLFCWQWSSVCLGWNWSTCKHHSTSWKHLVQI